MDWKADIVEQTKKRLEDMEKTLNGAHLATPELRRLAGELYPSLKKRTMAEVFEVCEELLSNRSWAFGVIVFNLAFRMRKRYDENTYPVFYHWLKEYVRGWGDCDDFCTHAFGELLRQQKEIFPLILEWTSDPDFWVRRAAAVVLIPAIMAEDLEGIDPLAIADKLLFDEHNLVLKGYGWMLKSLSQVDEKLVEDYLIANHEVMPRLAYRYALEKFDEDTRKRLMA